MPKYKVLRPIEHNQKLYMPETLTGPERVKSVGDGQEISVDASGTIELNEKEVQNFRQGQIESISEPAEAGRQFKRVKG